MLDLIHPFQEKHLVKDFESDLQGFFFFFLTLKIVTSISDMSQNTVGYTIASLLKHSFLYKLLFLSLFFAL